MNASRSCAGGGRTKQNRGQGYVISGGWEGSREGGAADYMYEKRVLRASKGRRTSNVSRMLKCGS